MNKYRSYSEWGVALTLAGEDEKAARLAALVIEKYEEDLRFDDPSVKYNGRCGRCNHTFEEMDVQHEIKNIIACDACYLWYVRPITPEDLEEPGEGEADAST